MAYTYETDPEFKTNFKRLTKKNKVLAERICSKIKDVCEYPARGEPLSGNLAGKWSIHVANHYVILYKIRDKDKIVTLLSVKHHDYVYGKKL